jgi:hypothetical protein
MNEAVEQNRNTRTLERQIGTFNRLVDKKARKTVTVNTITNKEKVGSSTTFTSHWAAN